MDREEPEDPDDETSALVTPCQVASRVKLPAMLCFDVIRALNAELTEYEREFGGIERPDRREGE